MEFKDLKHIHSVNTAEQTIEVSENSHFRVLRTDNTTIQSALDLHQPHKLVLPYMHAMMASLLFSSQPKHCLLLGLGGGELVRYLHHYLPQMDIHAVEYDQQMISICEQFFKLPKSDKLNIVHNEARHFITHNTHQYDLLLVDLYGQQVFTDILLDEGFYQHCHEHLSNTGVFCLNLIVNEAELFALILWKIRNVFNRRTLCLKVADHHNIIILAFKQQPSQLSKTSLMQDAQQTSTRFELDFEELVENLFTTNPNQDGELFFELA